MIQDVLYRLSYNALLVSTYFLTLHTLEIPTSDSEPYLQHPTIDKQVELLTESLKVLQTTSVRFLFSEKPVTSTLEILKTQLSFILSSLSDYIKKLLLTLAKTEVE